MELTDLLQPRKLEDYKSALGDYLRIVSLIGAVRSVCQFGIFGHNFAMGLSEDDIDLVMPVENLPAEYAGRCKNGTV